MIAIWTAAVLAATAPQGAAAMPVTGVMQAQAMEAPRFWSIMDRTAIHQADPDLQLQAVRAELEALSANEVLAFRNAFEAQLARAYSWDLWAVADIAHGGASDDGFDYFRRWMVSRGQVVFERLLLRPDDLADMLAADFVGVLEFEEILYVAEEVWSEKTGQELAAMPIDLASMTIGEGPAGEPFDDDPALQRRFPKTWARFGLKPLG